MNAFNFGRLEYVIDMPEVMGKLHAGEWYEQHRMRMWEALFNEFSWTEDCADFTSQTTGGQVWVNLNEFVAEYALDSLAEIESKLDEIAQTTAQQVLDIENLINKIVPLAIEDIEDGQDNNNHLYELLEQFKVPPVVDTVTQEDFVIEMLKFRIKNDM